MFMIHFFTDPYEDELIYSAISRYHFYTGNLDYKDTIEECFGKRTIVPTLELGSPIEELAKNIGGKYTSDYLIISTLLCHIISLSFQLEGTKKL